MKKAIAMIIVSILLAVALVLWWSLSGQTVSVMNLIISAAVLIMAASFIMEAIKRVKETRNGLAVDDEMTRRSEFKAGYISYLISVYLWVVLYFTRDKFSETGILLATGIMTMAAVFVIARIIYRHKAEA